MTSEWSVTSPRRCSVSSGGETLPRPPPHPRLPLPPPPFSPPAVRPGPLPPGDTDNVPDILEGGGDWHSESGGQECCPTPKTTGPSSQQITLWPVSTARVWGACSGTPCRKRPRPGRSTHLSGSQMVLSATMAFNTSAFAKGNKCAELGQQEKEGNHRIVTSEKLLEWHLTELIQVTDEGGPGAPEKRGTFPKEPQDWASPANGFTRRELRMSDGESTRRKQLSPTHHPSVMWKIPPLPSHRRERGHAPRIQLSAECVRSRMSQEACVLMTSTCPNKNLSTLGAMSFQVYPT